MLRNNLTSTLWFSAIPLSIQESGNLSLWLVLAVREALILIPKCSVALIQMQVNFSRNSGGNTSLWEYEALRQRGDKGLFKTVQVDAWETENIFRLHSLLLHGPFLTQANCAAVDQAKSKFFPFSFLPASSVKALHWTVVTSGDNVGGTDDWGAAYQYFRTADGYNVPWVHLCMNLIARWHVLSGWSKNPVWPRWRSRLGELDLSLK